MPITRFPSLSLADEHGLLAVGGDLSVESLVLAYSSGIFPWPIREDLLTWFAPPKRTLLFLDKVHISKSLQKARKKNLFTFKFNTNFAEVIRACAETKNRKGELQTTWITNEMVAAYINFHKAGYAHSIEAYSKDHLVGGLYGVAINNMFAGESMFYREENASKLAFWHLIEYLREQQIAWIDCQVSTPVSKSFGAVEVERDEFMQLLKKALHVRKSLFRKIII